MKIVPPIGVHSAVPNDIYHAQWEAASNSRLSKLRRSPAHLKAYLAEPAASTVALRVGRAAHSAILEPDDFDASFVIAGTCEAMKKGDGKRCGNNGVVLHGQLGWLCGVHLKGTRAGGDDARTVLTADDHAMCVAVRDSVFSHRAAAKLLSGVGQTEMSVVWNDFDTDLRCKARLDAHVPEQIDGIIVDVKTTRDAGTCAFERSIFDLGYHRQGAFYLAAAAAHGLPAQHFVIIAVEKEPPFAVAVYRLTEEAITAGRDQLRPTLDRYAACQASGSWPAYSEDMQDIALPPWAWKQVGDEVLASVVA